jgi:hypothetical protein
MKMIESSTRLPLRTLMVCFTLWLIATEALLFDQLKFNSRVELLEQAARAFHGPEVTGPTQRPAHLPSDVKLQRL